MRRFGKWLGRALLVLAAAVAALFLFGPREPLDLTARFGPASLPVDLDA
jgi:hypothetical protein